MLLIILDFFTAEETLKWTPGDIKCLIDQYELNIDRFDTMAKKRVWKDISEEMLRIRGKAFSVDQCNGKWKGLKSMYKKIKDHNSTSGNSRKNWEYFDALDSLLSKRPEIYPPATCSSFDNTVRLQESTSVDPDEMYRFNDTIQEMPENAPQSSVSRKRKADNIEAAKAKRHQEKMERVDRYLNLFEKLVDNITKE